MHGAREPRGVRDHPSHDGAPGGEGHPQEKEPGAVGQGMLAAVLGQSWAEGYCRAGSRAGAYIQFISS